MRLSATLRAAWLISLLLALSSSAFAVVDMRNANYSNTWVDLDLSEKTDIACPWCVDYEIKVSRTYNSMTQFNGIFGYGWCSDYETTLELNVEGIKIQDCGAGRVIHYNPADFDQKRIARLVSKIIEKIRAENKRSEESLVSLEQDLFAHIDLRQHYEKYIKPDEIELIDGMRYSSRGTGAEYVVYANGYFTLVHTDGATDRFDLRGRLVSKTDPLGNFLRMNYAQGRLQSVTDSKGRALIFGYGSNGKVAELSSGNLKVSYQYDRDDLVAVQDASGKRYLYTYDDMHDLLKATWPDNTFIAITYDKKNKWVTGFKDRENCQENYDYKEDANNPRYHYWSNVIKLCGEKVETRSKYEFWHSLSPSGEKYLRRMDLVNNGVYTSVSYDSTFHDLPIEKTLDGDEVTYSNYPDGRLASFQHVPHGAATYGSVIRRPALR